MIRSITIFGRIGLLALLFCSDSEGQMRLEGIGEVGGGIFLPTGSEGDVAQLSPALQLVASVRFSNHLGAEAEFLYVPIVFESDVLPLSAYKRSSQISAVAGPRFTSGALLGSTRATVAYLSLRAGFARIITETNTLLFEGGWIGRSAQAVENTGFTGTSYTSRREAFVLSPKVGTLFRLTERSAFNIAFFPIFVFDQDEVSTQFYITVTFALSAWQIF